MGNYRNFVDASWLAEHLHDQNLFVIDCRFDLFDPAEHGKLGYAAGHIEGAFYLDMDDDLSRDGGEHGGRRMLPDIDDLGEKLMSWGMKMDSTIICYDDGVYSAPRAWWQFKYMGYENVFVLDGGFSHWKECGHSVSKEIPVSREGGSFTANLHPEMYADVAYVKEAIGKPETVIVDSRAHNRYTGEYEPLYRKKGHLPGAMSMHYLGNLRDGEDPRFIGTPEQWKRNFGECPDVGEVILYCGSGIEACVNFMCLAEIGKSARVYIGSMSDWVTYDDLEVESIA